MATSVFGIILSQIGLIQSIKIIKDINIEIIHDKNEQRPTDGKWKETIRTDIDRYRNDPILHVTFTDNSKADIPLKTDSMVRHLVGKIWMMNYIKNYRLVSR